MTDLAAARAARAGRSIALGLGLALVSAGCSSPAPSPAPSPSAVVDGLAIGPDRETTGTLFHHLETAARGYWLGLHSQNPSSFGLHHAGVLADGSLQAGTDAALVFLMVITVPGGEEHALVLQCSPLATTDSGTCQVVGGTQ